jgi:hypothetical protein
VRVAALPSALHLAPRKCNVENIPDPDTVVSLAAHVDYWKNDLVWQQLYTRIAP